MKEYSNLSNLPKAFVLEHSKDGVSFLRIPAFVQLFELALSSWSCYFPEHLLDG